MTGLRHHTLSTDHNRGPVLPMDAKPPRLRRIEPMERPAWLQRVLRHG